MFYSCTYRTHRLFSLSHTRARKKGKKVKDLSLSLFPFLLSRPRRALSEASSSMQGFLPSFLPPAAFEEVISSTLAGGGDPYSISRDWRRRRRNGEGSFFISPFLALSTVQKCRGWGGAKDAFLFYGGGGGDEIVKASLFHSSSFQEEG